MLRALTSSLSIRVFGGGGGVGRGGREEGEKGPTVVARVRFMWVVGSRPCSKRFFSLAC